MAAQHEPWMSQALILAERGRGFVEPNPLVGAVVVRDGVLVGQGWHDRFGQAHAEVHALAGAGSSARGATLYVTLEPCCHQGKTPPCTEAILRAGIGRVVAAMTDPFPQVAGQGLARLRAAGIEVEVGVGEPEARQLNAPYLKRLATGRPWVIAKWAMTLDGKIASRTGDSKWISGEAARRRVHELRGRVDAIIVGIGTVLADDPLLTARPPGPRTATRIVLDSSARLPASSQLVKTARDVPVIDVSCWKTSTPAHAAGVTCLWLAPEQGRPPITHLLDELGRQGMTNVLVEGGAQVLGSFLDAGEIDEVWAFIAPKLLGGATARSALGGEGAARLADALRLPFLQVEQVDEDLLIRAWKLPERSAVRGEHRQAGH